MIDEPAKIECTMKLTMTLQEWQELREQLASKWPACELSRLITDLLTQARRVYYPTEPL